VFPTPNGKKEFCAETCLSEFRKAMAKVGIFYKQKIQYNTKYVQGTCLNCKEVIRGSPVKWEVADQAVKLFCTDACLGKHKQGQQKKNGESTPSNAGRKPGISACSNIMPSDFGNFDWAAYLAETNSKSAPNKCFKVDFRLFSCT